MDLRNVLIAWWRDEAGQDLVEYTLLLAFVAMASAALLLDNMRAVQAIWNQTYDNLYRAEHGTGL